MQWLSTMCWCCYMCCVLCCDTRQRRRARRAARSRRSLRSQTFNSFPDASFRNTGVPRANSFAEVPLGVGFGGTASGTTGPPCRQQGLVGVLVGGPGVGGGGLGGPSGARTYASSVHVPIEGGRTLRNAMAPASPYGGPIQQQMQSQAQKATYRRKKREPLDVTGAYCCFPDDCCAPESDWVCCDYCPCCVSSWRYSAQRGIKF